MLVGNKIHFQKWNPYKFIANPSILLINDNRIEKTTTKNKKTQKQIKKSNWKLSHIVCLFWQAICSLGCCQCAE